MNKKILEEIGMTPNEIEVYLSLLKVGLSTTTNIIKESKVHASKIYSILDRLIDKGFATKTIINKKTQYQVSDPEMIKIYLENKRKNIDSQLTEIKKIMPEIRNLKESKSKDEEVQVFLGWKGLEIAFRDILRTLKRGETQYAIGGIYLENVQAQNNFLESFKIERDKQEIKTKIILSKSARGKFPAYEKSKLTEIKYVNQDIPTYLDIYKNKVIISLIKKRPIVIQIKSQEMADSFIEYFKMLWKISKT